MGWRQTADKLAEFSHIPIFISHMSYQIFILNCLKKKNVMANPGWCLESLLFLWIYKNKQIMWKFWDVRKPWEIIYKEEIQETVLYCFAKWHYTGHFSCLGKYKQTKVKCFAYNLHKKWGGELGEHTPVSTTSGYVFCIFDIDYFFPLAFETSDNYIFWQVEILWKMWILVSRRNKLDFEFYLSAVPN